jgi:hypothetical protein
MKRPGLIRGVLILTLFYMFNGVVHRLNIHSCPQSSVRVHIKNDDLAVEEQCAIETLLITLHAHTECTAQSCITQVQAQFPYLSHGTVSFEPGAQTVYTFEACKPVCLVNGAYLLFYNGVAMRKDILRASVYTHVPVICVDQELLHNSLAMRAVAHAMVNVEPTIAQSYTMLWHTLYAGFITVPFDPPFQIMFDVAHVPTTPLLAHCTTIYRELSDTQVPDRGEWIADIRFNNQIIVYRGKGGGYG